MSLGLPGSSCPPNPCSCAHPSPMLAPSHLPCMQVLRVMGILKYGDALAAKASGLCALWRGQISVWRGGPGRSRADEAFLPSLALRLQLEAKAEIAPGSEEEVELRACTVVATEMLRAELVSRNPGACSVCLDWWLWEQGERQKQEHPPFHRTLTIFY